MKEFNNIGKKMSMTIKCMLRKLGERLESADVPITWIEYIVLSIVNGKEEVIQQDLADKLGRDKSAILRTVRGLEESRLLARITDSNDKRRNILVITKQGVDMLERAAPIHKKLQDDFLEGVSEEQLYTFFEVLETIQKNAQK